MTEKILINLKDGETGNTYGIYVSPDEAVLMESAFKWPHEAILLLIEEYRVRQNDFFTGKMSHKKIWVLISEVMIQHGYNVTGPQCLSKFSGLKRTYKAVKDHNQKSGSGARTWTYYALMNDLLGSKPYMSPIATTSSSGKRTLLESVGECNTSDESVLDESQPKKRRQAYFQEYLLAELKESRAKAEAAAEKRHQENVEIRQRLLTSFENMVDILKNSTKK